MELEGLKETRRELRKVEAIEQLENDTNSDNQNVSDKVLIFQHLEKTRETLAKHYGLKVNEVQLLIRLTHLCKELLELVDDGKIQEYVAAPLTFLSEEFQITVYHLVNEKSYKLDLPMSKLLKDRYQSGKLDAVDIDAILSGKETVTPPKPKITPIKIKPAVVKKYFTKGESQKDIQQTIEKALELYFSKKDNL